MHTTRDKLRPKFFASSSCTPESSPATSPVSIVSFCVSSFLLPLTLHDIHVTVCGGVPEDLSDVQTSYYPSPGPLLTPPRDPPGPSLSSPCLDLLPSRKHVVHTHTHIRPPVRPSTVRSRDPSRPHVRSTSSLDLVPGRRGTDRTLVPSSGTRHRLTSVVTPCSRLRSTSRVGDGVKMDTLEDPVHDTPRSKESIVPTPSLVTTKRVSTFTGLVGLWG